MGWDGSGWNGMGVEGRGGEGLTELIAYVVGASVVAFLTSVETSPEPVGVFFFRQSNGIFSALDKVQSSKGHASWCAGYG